MSESCCVKALSICLNLDYCLIKIAISLVFQSSTVDNIAATVAKDTDVQAAAVSLVKAASAASGAYWTAAPKVSPGVPSAALRQQFCSRQLEVAVLVSVTAE